MGKIPEIFSQKGRNNHQHDCGHLRKEEEEKRSGEGPVDEEAGE